MVEFQNASRLKRIAIEEIDRLRDELIDLSLRIHANPELAFEEYKAVEWLTGALEARGFRVERGSCDLATAFRASFGRGNGPRIALLAEYDALAKLGHACGHNIMGTASVGAAIAVSKVMSNLDGEVLVIGTPAEEGGGGKAIMIERAAFADIDAAMIVHPGTKTRVVTRALASATIEVEFRGKSAHAASRPEDGVNALDAMILSYNNINALRQHIRRDARIHGIITSGGEAPNIVPSYASGRFFVRAEDDLYLDGLLEKVLDCFRGGEKASGARLTYHMPEARYAPLRNNMALAEAFGANLRELGVAVQPEDPNRASGSTDMGNVSQVVPAIHPSIGIAEETISTHSPEFATAAISESGHHGLLNAAKALAMTTIDLLTNAKLLAQMKEEFARK
ncbi:MAG: M20 family metallopeptidase [Dehalococcoidales bacterium]|nr:M20 family metallopeptidase [Dehalococcoidales bacterium]